MPEHELKNAYIGEYRVPWANTVAYYPLNSTTTVNDMKGSGTVYNLTNSWATFWIYDWADCANLNWSSYMLSNVWDISQYSHTINFWVYVKWDGFINMYWEWNPNYKGGAELIQYYQSKFRYSYWYDDLDSINTYPTNWWHNICVQFDKSNSSQIIYVDGVLQWSRTTTYTHTLYNTNNFTFWKNTVYSEEYLNWHISEYILENKLWSSNEISTYYNLTKSNYGL